MEQQKSIQEKLDHLASAMLLFSDDTLVLINSYGKRLLPGIAPGISAEELLGDGAEQLKSFSGSGAMLFPTEISGLCLNAKVTSYDEYTALELVEPTESLSLTALRSIAEGLLTPITTVMALTPKLLPQLEADNANMTRAAQLNRGIYALYRTANHLRLAGMRQQEWFGSKKQVHFTTWLWDFADRLRPMVESAQRQLLVDIPQINDTCDLDTEQMERALLNLISNAIKYTEPDGVIQLLVTKTARGRLRLTVRDNGCGIPSYEVGLLFQRKEYRPQIPDPRCGIGLGLTIVRNIIQAHGGTIMLESQENAGTSVHLSLTPVKMNHYSLHTTIQKPSFSGGFDPMLVELADALPSPLFDTRGVDL